MVGGAAEEAYLQLQSLCDLELTTAEGPAGFMLVADGDDDAKHRRIAYFRLGSRESLSNQAIEYDLGGGAHNKPRGWDWEDELVIKTVAIV